MNSLKSILKDFKSTWFVSLILIIGMLPLWAAGYCMYVLIILLPIVFWGIRKYSGLSWLVILFSIFYTGTQILNGHTYTPSALLFDLFFPFIMCQAGQYIVARQKRPETSVTLLVLMAAALASPAIVENVMDTVTSGQLINTTRAILDNTGGITRSATGYGMMLAIMDGCIGVLLLVTHNKFDARLKLWLFILSILALFSTIHLLNRTGLVIALVSLIAVVVLPPYSLKKFMYFVLVSLIVIGIGVYFLQGSDFLIDALNFYEDRDLQTGGSVASFGGRTQRWAAGLQQLFTEPFGNNNGVRMGRTYTYAHNMWLDAGARGGFFCFVLLLIIGIIFIDNAYKAYKISVLSRFERELLLLISIAMFLQLNTEPVIEGLPQFFWYFIFFTSLTLSLNIKYRTR